MRETEAGRRERAREGEFTEERVRERGERGRVMGEDFPFWGLFFSAFLLFFWRFLVAWMKNRGRGKGSLGLGRVIREWVGLDGLGI